eukprot:TRINITY_DN23027_c0_g1_i2.p1 TRINITY_DN23027_c0_g1~~TRINITY_DN23027_c0_g1_i2.p1  ORF type:complete len:419 (-),score=56.15 TRINITY_DN23027_c0_g1_i2:19-1275(-)
MCIFCERAQNQLLDGLTPSQKKQVESCEKLRDSRIRTTILTGFLGAGKTTFLNYVLKSQAHGEKIGVVQNEFGTVSIDDMLMPKQELRGAEVVVMPNGCLCCRVRGDLVEALKNMARTQNAVAPSDSDAGEAGPKPDIDSLIIECSGLSEVLPVAQTFFADPYVQAAFQLDGVVCVCDAGNFETLEAGGDDSDKAGQAVAKLLREQLAVSDICLLNKCDLVDTGKRDRISARIRSLTPSIKVVPCRQGKVNLRQVLKVGSFSLETALSLDEHFLGLESPPPPPAGGFCAQYRPPLRVAPNRDIHAHGGFGNLGLEVEAQIDMTAFKNWLMTVVEKHGDKLLRLKGVLQPKCSPDVTSKRVIVQGVGGHIEIGEDADDQTDVKQTKSRLVFIGVLDDAFRTELQTGFYSTTVPVSAPSA